MMPFAPSFRPAAVVVVLGLTIGGCGAPRGLLAPTPFVQTALRQHATGCSGVTLSPSDAATVQHALSAHPPGTTFCFAAGTYRFVRGIEPKAGQRLISATPHGAILDGAKLIGPFERSGNAYVARAFLTQSPASSTNCAVAASLCDTRQDVFFDGRPLVRVTAGSLVRPGTFYEDFTANKLWIGRNPSGHSVEQAYAPQLVVSQAGGLVVQGFVVEFAANQAQSGAIQSYGYTGNGWTVEANLVRYNHAAGIGSVPSLGNTNGSLIEGNTILGNGQEGVAAVGDSLTIRDNEIAGNNRVNYSCWWECGGAKFAGGPGYENRDLTVEGNFVHDNNGPGFWNDINSYNMVYRNNRVVRNFETNGPYGLTIGSGIFIEISDRALIEDNDVEDNGPRPLRNNTVSFYLGGQIEVSASANVTVTHNRVRGAGGIGMLQQDRTDSCIFGKRHSSSYPDGSPVCPHVYAGKPIHWVHDNTFRNNTIAETAPPTQAEAAGLDCDLRNDAAVFSAANGNVFADNAYALPKPSGVYFSWLNRLMNAAAWQANGQDAGSSF